MRNPYKVKRMDAGYGGGHKYARAMQMPSPYYSPKEAKHSGGMSNLSACSKRFLPFVLLLISIGLLYFLLTFQYGMLATDARREDDLETFIISGNRKDSAQYQAYAMLTDAKNLDRALQLAEQIRQFDTERSIVFIMDGSSSDSIQSAYSQGLELLQVELIDTEVLLQHAIDFMQMNSRQSVNIARVSDVLTKHPRLLLWFCKHYTSIVYLHPHTHVQGDIREIFASCTYNALYVSPLFPNDQRTRKDQSLAFRTEMMVVNPYVKAKTHLCEVLSKWQKLLYHEQDFLWIAFAKDWGTLPKEYNILHTKATPNVDHNVKTYINFPINVQLLTFGVKGTYGYDNMEITAAVNSLYCESKGIDFVEKGKRTLPSTVVSAKFDIYSMVKENLDKYDYILYVDADAYITDLETDVRKIIHEYDTDIIVGVGRYGYFSMTTIRNFITGQNQRAFPPVNAGVMIFKNSKWTMAFLDYLLSLEEPYCRKCAHFGKSACGGTSDQACLEHLYNEDIFNLQSHFNIIPLGVLQRYTLDAHNKMVTDLFSSSHSFITHAAGISDIDQRNRYLCRGVYDVLAGHYNTTFAFRRLPNICNQFFGTFQSFPRRS